MADEDHSLEQTLRLHDPALDRALSIDRESDELYLPWEEADAERRRGPRECPEPLWEAPGAFEMRVASKVGRDDSCPCGNGRKEKSCCGIEGRLDKFRSCCLPPPLDAEERVVRRADEILQGADATGTA